MDHDLIAGVCLGIQRIIEDDLGLGVEVCLARRDDLLGVNDIVRRTRGDAPDLNGHRNRQVFLSEEQSHHGDDLVLGEAESLCKRIPPIPSPPPSPHCPDHWNTDDPLLNDSLLLDYGIGDPASTRSSASFGGAVSEHKERQ